MAPQRFLDLDRAKFALRACITNHRTTSRDLDVLIDEVLDAASIRLRGEHGQREAL